MDTTNNVPRCQTCKHWSRRLSERYSAAFEEFINIPTKFGRCRSQECYKATDIEVSTSVGAGDLYSDSEVLLSQDDLDVEFSTWENFGCVFHEEQQ